MEALRDLPADQRKTSDIILALNALATKLKIRTATKLLQAARGVIDGATGKLAAAALEGVTSKQLLAPAPRSTGKSASEGLGRIFQADLVDFSQNSNGKDGVNKYALMLVDVFSREVFSEPLPNKKPETVNKVFDQILDVPAGQQTKVTTDKGGEFSRLNEKAGVVHVTKAPSDPNGIAVLDRATQTVKKDISADLIDGEYQYWDDALEPVVDAYNGRPHGTTTVAPSEVENNGHAHFRLLQKNASNFAVNRSQTIARTAQVKEAGAFRAYEPNSRSFNPQWGKAF
jgi:hypothetical protein